MGSWHAAQLKLADTRTPSIRENRSHTCPEGGSRRHYELL
jgi:hypothetical protein